MTAFGRIILVSNKFYEILTQSPKDHVVLSTNEDGSDGVPYKPQAFPVGIWNVRMPQTRSSPFTAPYFIPTDAHQFVEEWELDEHERYKCKTGRLVMDWGYGLHHSAIDYTFGCLKILDARDVFWLAEQITDFLTHARNVTMEVAV